MNKLLLFFSIVFSFSVFAQKVDYDHTSKWFLGFNIGGAWQTTDVTNKTNLGYGLTLGKSYNYDYGRVLSFDLRARYLTGKWRGQDFDTTDLSNYNISNGVLTDYKNTYGFTINNFETTVHRLGLELVIHANSFKDRTNIDPYIFGGIGLTWHQTYGDIIDFTSSQSGGLYNYDPSITYTQTELTTLMDGILDTPLDGSKLDKFRVGFMPSLGFGLGYQIGKYTTFGFEHKTTFTLIDDFDGYSKTSKYNDIYHYTSLYLNFRFRTNNNIRNTNFTNNQTNSSGKVDGYTTGSNACPKPTIRLVYPSAASTSNVKTETYQLSTEISNITSIEDIVFTQNGTRNQNGQYNAQTRRFTATVFLTPGMNTFEVSAKNQCGDAKSNFVINYTPCLSPIVSFTNPQIANGSTEIINYTLTANVSNIQNGQLTLKHNNFNITNYNYNATSGLVQATVSLSPGNNTFFIGGKNECGEATQTSSINYTFCAAPIISFIQPTVDGTTVNSAVYNLNALIQNVNNGTIVLLLNNKTIPNPSFNKNTGTLLATLNLVVGINTITIKSTNSCGTDTKTITIDYRRCLAPQITLVNPNNTITTAINQAFNLSALVQNSTNITLTNNGSSINYNFNSQTGSLQAATTLNQGVNTFVITAINTCGTDVETFTVNYNPCVLPQISLVNPINSNSTVSNQAFNLTALVQNSNNITLTKNGSTINYNFNSQTGSLQAATTLSQGVNTFVITAINTCGTDVETLTVNYNPCVAPQITLVNPSNSITTANNQVFNFSALVQNSTNITLTKNGSTINYNFNSQSGSLQAATTLNQGVNTFVITAINTCGTDVETFTVNYNPCVAPQITLVNPSNANTTATNQSFNLNALVQNSSNITLTKNGTTINYNFNNQTGSLQAATTLNQGVNTFVITAINTCGTDVKTFTVNYNPCVVPQIAMIKPATANSMAENENYTIAATIQNSTSVLLTQNGVAINTNFNSQTGSFQASTTLNQGTNTFVLTASNPCGTDVETFTLNFTSAPCVAPQITVVNPNQTTFVADNNPFNFSAIASSLLNASVTLTQNGNAVTNLMINQTTGTIQKNCMLITGSNVFVLTVTNACGRDSKTIEINYNPCLKPVINFAIPNGTTVNNSQFNLTASIQNFTQIQYKIQTNTTQEGIEFTHNGQTSYDYTYNSETGAFSSNATLIPGLNTFVLTVTNPCGTTTATFTINYVICNKPTITAVQVSKNSINVSDSIYNFKAYLTGINSKQNCQLKLNNQSTNIFDFNTTTNLLSATFKLKKGLNQLNVKVTSNCGEEIQNFSINYTPLKPVVTPIRPKPSLPETKPSTPESKPGGRGSGRNR
jgi:alpha-L-arabinofuranosidase